MKRRGYLVRVETERVLVEHRASVRPRTIVWLAGGYFCYCMLPYVRKPLVELYRSRDPVIGGFALFMLLIPILGGATWLFFASGEVMRCDARELQFARRRTWGRWHRFRFSTGQVRCLQRAHRGGPKSRNFEVLTFQVGGKTYDMLENLNAIEADKILRACKALGLDAILTVRDDTAMQHDIARRGWFIKPLRSDEDEVDSAKKL